MVDVHKGYNRVDVKSYIGDAKGCIARPQVRKRFARGQLGVRCAPLPARRLVSAVLSNTLRALNNALAGGGGSEASPPALLKAAIALHEDYSLLGGGAPPLRPLLDPHL
eukprot:1179737-Prorocentrum_minimum.AAC.3